MNLAGLEHLICPATGEPLFFEDTTISDTGTTGAFVNISKTQRYPVIDGVIDFTRQSGPSAEQAHTLDLFGSEWARFDRWGWLDALPDEPGADLKYWGGLLENTRSAFRGKAPFQPGDLGPGKLVLDVGCGNGRFSLMAAETGAIVFALDASEAAFVAKRNLGDRVTVIRANVLQMPFKAGTFDAAFSIGVMQHTGDGFGLLKELVRVVRPGSPFTVNCYGRGLATYETIDALIRKVVTRLDRTRQMQIAGVLAGFDRALRRGGRGRQALRTFLFRHMNLLPTDIHMFDWYSPALADHYTAEQLREWLSCLRATVTHAGPQFHAAGYNDEPRRRTHGAFQFRATTPSAT